ncbi:DUF1772 domain-containing protein [Streptomyces pristinaespiralis]|jgi:uncharacterized membrane protein|uniref:DUF1772 domain-containing protein n=2 Tax=Streptomyces pristinaespiralis TaxID=38300 RepID=D6X8A7_STRE2|nr:DUF1772 domain-containing protein [Streptomyces pristinaespiralis]ALC18449.1 membrane protein [Streptomyces pristinaespiralis]ALC25516.1 membrane protein [Streptomyces pristinaespiralis]EFH32292.1 conserved hypothetical protein [Streptomyces pristinaespiralis ATCC 25486]QMU12292.1 DUF1772 domain-containing protein [Streptomyces pristinaespiralis]
MAANPYHPYGPANPYAPAPPPPRPARRPSRTTGPLLVTSTVTMGLMAGLFFTFDVSIMPGLARTDDRFYVEAMQNFNELIDNSGLFALVFIGAFVATTTAAVLDFRRGHRSPALWATVAATLYLVALLITFSVNIPLNMELAQLGDPAKVTDFALVDKFKGIWETTNIMRTLLCAAALGCLAHCLKLHGRATATAPAPAAPQAPPPHFPPYAPRTG